MHHKKVIKIAKDREGVCHTYNGLISRTDRRDVTAEKAVPRRIGRGPGTWGAKGGCGWRCGGGGMCVATRRGDEAAVPEGTVQAAVSRLSTGGQ